MSQARRLTILQMNDTHGYIETHPELFWEAGGETYRPAGGYSRLATLVKEARQENQGGVILLDNGDTLHGTYPAVHTQGQALVPLLNQLRPGAMTAHWEFAYGPKVFKQRAGELTYPVLALNIREKETGQNFFPSYRIIEAAGLRVGVIGLASNIVDKTMPPHFSEGLSFDLGREELPGTIETLRAQENADLIVVLSHLGFPQDYQLAQDVSGINILLSGHTHNRLYHPVRQGETLIIQSGSHGSFLGRLDVELQDKQVVDFRHQLIEVTNNIPVDSEMEALVQEVMVPYRGLLDEVIGETLTPLNRGYNQETTMDNFLLRALREQTGARVAFSNGWRYGAPIPAGPVTLNDLYNIIPDNPPVSTVDLTGEELIEILEENMEHTYAQNPYNQLGGYLKRALGLKAYFKVENPSGQRIQQLFVSGEEVQPKQTYPTVFVTAQGVPGKYGTNRQQLDLKAVDVLREYVKKHSPVKSELEGTFILI